MANFTLHFMSGVKYGLCIGAAMTLATIRHGITLLRFALVCAIAALYIIEGLHNMLVFWADLQVKQHAKKPVLAIEPAKPVLMLSPAPVAPKRKRRTAPKAQPVVVAQPTVKELRALCKTAGLKGYSKLPKAQLLEFYLNRL